MSRKRKYTDEFRLNAVLEYLSGENGGFETLSKKYGIAYSQLKRWVHLYEQHGADGLTKSSGTYSGEFKVYVIEYMTDMAKVLEKLKKENGGKDPMLSALRKMNSIEVVELEESRGDSVMTLTATNLKFNKATAAELGFPNYIRMLVHAPSRKVAIEPCKENTKNAVPFSKDASKQTYAIVVKIPALLAAARKLADVDENSGSISFKGTLYPKEKIIIYDLSKGEPTKRRGGHQKKEVPAEVIEEAETSNNIEETTE